MNLTPEAEARIDDRIRRLSRRPGATAERDELRSHVADAAEGLAAPRPALPTHVDAAFAGLGSDDDIRAAFFPAPPRAAVSHLHMGLLASATLLAAAAILGNGGGTASCSVQGPGTCSASASGDAMDLVVWAGPPLAVLALLVFLPAWTAVAAAGLYVLVSLVRVIDVATIGDFEVLDLLLLAAGALSLTVAARHWRQARRLADA